MQQGTQETSRGAGIIHWACWYDLLGTLLPFGRENRNQLLERAAPLPGENALDVGCGPGTLTLSLKSRVGAGKVFGIDPSPEMIAVARKKAAKARAGVDFRVGGVEALPLPDSSFDLVTSAMMFHHVPGALKRTGAAEIRRVLKPGGRFLALDFAVQVHSALGHLLAILGRARGQSTVAELTPLLKEAGFREVEAIPARDKNFTFLRAR